MHGGIGMKHTEDELKESAEQKGLTLRTNGYNYTTISLGTSHQAFRASLLV